MLLTSYPIPSVCCLARLTTVDMSLLSRLSYIDLSLFHRQFRKAVLRNEEMQWDQGISLVTKALAETLLRPGLPCATYPLRWKRL
jgi:hypothetical protein